MIVRVKRKHYRTGKRRSPASCAIALAIADSLPSPPITLCTGLDSVYWALDEEHGDGSHLPWHACVALRLFDRGWGRVLPPFWFRLKDHPSKVSAWMFSSARWWPHKPRWRGAWRRAYDRTPIWAMAAVIIPLNAILTLALHNWVTPHWHGPIEALATGLLTGSAMSLTGVWLAGAITSPTARLRRNR